jgi:Protein of unknown function (DUF4058)
MHAMARLFPGIDPFIEAQGSWPDFHVRAINYLSGAIADHLPDSYDVRIEERIQFVEYPADHAKRMEPDMIIERSSGFSTSKEGVAVLEMEPTAIPIMLLEEEREVYLEITRRPDRNLVAVVELLSPDN